MFLSLGISIFWNDLGFIKNLIHYILDPTLGALLRWNLTEGMLIIIFLISLFTVIIQKYFTDQDSLKRLKVEQKKLQEEMKKFRGDAKKTIELQKEWSKALPETFKLNLRPMIITSIPLILFFRWFMDFFQTISNPKLFLGLSWFLFYLIFVVIFNMLLKKFLKVI